MLNAIPAMVHSPLRITRPAIREGWREGRERTGHDAFREVSWDEALSVVASEVARVRDTYGAGGLFGGSHGWSSAGRVHHARTLVRRFLFLGGGYVNTVGNYSFGAAMYLLPHVIGTMEPVAGRVTEWPNVVKHTRLIVAFGGLALKNGQVTSGGAGVHVMEQWLRRAKDAGIEFVVVSPLKSDAPDFLGAQWLADPAEYRHRPDARDGAHVAGRAALRRGLRGAPLRRLRHLRPRAAGPRTTARPRPPNGRRRSPASPPMRSATSRAAPPRPAA